MKKVEDKNLISYATNVFDASVKQTEKLKFCDISEG